MLHDRFSTELLAPCITSSQPSEFDDLVRAVGREKGLERLSVIKDYWDHACSLGLTMADLKFQLKGGTSPF